MYHVETSLTTPTYSINSVDGGNTLAHDVGNDTGQVDKWTLCVCVVCMCVCVVCGVCVCGVCVNSVHVYQCRCVGAMSVCVHVCGGCMCGVCVCVHVCMYRCV